jgi:uncharacterized peroxidase-related enzyme
MPNLKPVNPSEAAGKAKQLFDAVEKNLGMVPNMMRLMVNSPAVLQAYLAFSGALAEGSLTAKLREQIALAVANVNECNYCLSAHNVLGKLAGLSKEDLGAAQHAEAADAKTAAALGFAVKVVRARGHLQVAEVDALRAAGYTDGEVAEIIATVAVNIFTNYFNHIVATEIDFPVVKTAAAAR